MADLKDKLSATEVALAAAREEIEKLKNQLSEAEEKNADLVHDLKNAKRATKMLEQDLLLAQSVNTEKQKPPRSSSSSRYPARDYKPAESWKSNDWKKSYDHWNPHDYWPGTQTTGSSGSSLNQFGSGLRWSTIVDIIGEEAQEIFTFHMKEGTFNKCFKSRNGNHVNFRNERYMVILFQLNICVYHARENALSYQEKGMLNHRRKGIFHQILNLSKNPMEIVPEYEKDEAGEYFFPPMDNETGLILNLYAKIQSTLERVLHEL